MWLIKLEKKFGKYAIPNLPMIIVALYAVGFVLQLTMPGINEMLALKPALILQGQVWRLFTFLLIGPSTNLIFVVFVLLFYYSIGTSLEQVWGSFRFNVYYFIGVLGTIVGAFLTYEIYIASGYAFLTNLIQMDTFYLNMTLFLAYAAMFPDAQVLLYMIVPIRIKYLGYLDGIYLVYQFIASGIDVAGVGIKVSIVVAILNFLLFFFSMRTIKRKGRSAFTQATGMKRKRDFRKKVSKGAKKDGAIHECAVCHRTELDDPTLEFRYCSKCDGEYEYCQDHLFTHKHVKK